MSAARITTHKSVLPGRYNVRYGTPSSFDHLGVVTKVVDGCWSARTAEGVDLGASFTRAEAVALLVDDAFVAVTMCEWFAMCDHIAVGFVHHPVLGDTPVCQRCATTHGLDLVGGAS